MTETIPCPDCGHRNPAGSVHCEACNFPIVSEIDMAIGDLTMVSARSRAVALVGETGLDLIARDSKTFWNYFRPMVTDDRFAEKVFKYLSGEENDAPALVHRANLESQQGAGF